MLVAALVVGVLIGCVGIGGVLMTPALVYVGGLGFHLAAATSMWAFLFAGAAGTFRHDLALLLDPCVAVEVSPRNG